MRKSLAAAFLWLFSSSLPAQVGTIREDEIRDGSILARVASSESISGSWAFTAPLLVDNAQELRLGELDANGSNYVGLKAPSILAANQVWTLPSADGTAGFVLKTDGAGNLGWASNTSGSALDSEPYVTVSNTAGLSAERALAGTADQLTVTDNGADSTVVLSLPASVILATSLQVPLVSSSGALAFTPAAGSNVNVTTSGTGNFAVNATEFVVDAGAGIGVGTASPSHSLHVFSSTASVLGRLQTTALNLNASLVLENDAQAWRLFVQGAGGAPDWFIIEDNTTGNDVAVFEKGAPANSLYVKASGTVGFGSIETGGLLDNDGTNFFDGTVPAGSFITGIDSTGLFTTGSNAATATTASGLACTDCVALGTETTGNYAAGDAEAGNATGLVCTTCVDTTDVAGSAITYSKIQNVSATSRVLGRITTGAGVVEELTGANIRTIANVGDGADITGITTAANSGLAGGAVSGGVSLTLDVNNLAAETIASGGDFIAKYDGAVTEKITLTNAFSQILGAGLDEQFLTRETTGGPYAWENLCDNITGTANRVTVSGTTDCTLSGPQDIHTGASPTFGGLTLSGTSTVVFNPLFDASSIVVVEGTVTPPTKIAGYLSITIGGTSYWLAVYKSNPAA